MPDPNRGAWASFKKWMVGQWVGIVGFVVAIITLGYTIPMLKLAIDTLNLTRKALDEAIRANWLASQSLNEAIFATRLALMQLCLQNVTINEIVCRNVTGWTESYLPWLLDAVYPGNGTQLLQNIPDHLQESAFASTSAGKGVISYGAVSSILVIGMVAVLMVGGSQAALFRGHQMETLDANGRAVTT